MSAQKNLKSHDLAEKLNLAEKIKVDGRGLVSIDEDYYSSSLEAAKLPEISTIEKIQKHDASLLAATTLVVGEKVAEVFKKHPDLTETSFNYMAGNNKVFGYFEREGKTPVRNVVEVHGAGDRGELGKVHRHLKDLYADVNN